MAFYQPMLRGEECAMSSPDHDRSVSPPTSPAAGLVHIDTDFGAHDLDGILDLVGNNLVSEGIEFPRHKFAELIRDGRKRFAIVNCWRNADQFGRPIMRAPLGFLLPWYSRNGERHRFRPCFPESAPEYHRSRWYTYPRMAEDECLLFKQYDRRLDLISDIWHCSLRHPPSLQEKISDDKKDHTPKRRSFDIRAFIVFDESVPEDNDRYSPGRLRPGLSLEESGCFCDEQARRRGGNDSSKPEP
mmetsp:Transcript_32413/g.59592  ORF Transcript_32413/g.59592 Transcript_32413/m.59592 type:complete len:244 (+) Transcript_32413:679-1410(+)